jgi:hypothetical protein
MTNLYYLYYLYVFWYQNLPDKLIGFGADESACRLHYLCTPEFDKLRASHDLLQSGMHNHKAIGDRAGLEPCPARFRSLVMKLNKDQSKVSC